MESRRVGPGAEALPGSLGTPGRKVEFKGEGLCRPGPWGVTLGRPVSLGLRILVGLVFYPSRPQSYTPTPPLNPVPATTDHVASTLLCPLGFLSQALL